MKENDLRHSSLKDRDKRILQVNAEVDDLYHQLTSLMTMWNKRFPNSKVDVDPFHRFHASLENAVNELSTNLSVKLVTTGNLEGVSDISKLFEDYKCISAEVKGKVIEITLTLPSTSSPQE